MSDERERLNSMEPTAPGEPTRDADPSADGAPVLGPTESAEAVEGVAPGSAAGATAGGVAAGTERVEADADAVADAVEQEEPWPPREMSATEATVVGLVFLLVGCLALAWHMPPEDPQPNLEYWRPSGEAAQRMDYEGKQRLAAAQVAEQDIERLQSGLARMHQALFTAANPNAAQAIEAQYAASVRAFVKARGADAYLAVGQTLLVAFQAHLRRLQETWAGYEGTLAEWMRENTDNHDLRALRLLSGIFVERAVAAGLVGPGVAVDGDRLRVASVLWRGYWIQGMGPKAPDQYLSKDERLLMIRFKAEAGQDLPDNRRWALAKAADGSDGYPAQLVQGVLAARAGEYEDAVESLSGAWLSGQHSSEARAWWVALHVRTGQFFIWR